VARGVAGPAIAPARAAALLLRVRERSPLIHHITNIVTANDVANVTLAVGAAPVMALAVEEVEEVAAAAGAVVLNIGTPTPQIVDAMVRAGRRANARGVPVVLDPVGAGATAFRTAQARRVLQAVRVACVRGNAGEVAALAGRAGAIRGVDAMGEVDALDELARGLARETRAVVAATGPIDLLTDGARTVHVQNGHPLLTRITGSGCMASAIVGAFCAVEPDILCAASAGLICYGVAAECAAEGSPGPGTFRTSLMDALAALDADTVTRRARVRT